MCTMCQYMLSQDYKVLQANLGVWFGLKTTSENWRLWAAEGESNQVSRIIEGLDSALVKAVFIWLVSIVTRLLQCTLVLDQQSHIVQLRTKICTKKRAFLTGFGDHIRWDAKRFLFWRSKSGRKSFFMWFCKKKILID